MKNYWDIISKKTKEQPTPGVTYNYYFDASTVNYLIIAVLVVVFLSVFFSKIIGKAVE